MTLTASVNWNRRILTLNSTSSVAYYANEVRATYDMVPNIAIMDIMHCIELNSTGKIMQSGLLWTKENLETSCNVLHAFSSTHAKPCSFMSEVRQCLSHYTTLKIHMLLCLCVEPIDILYTLDSASNYSAIQKLKPWLQAQGIPMKWEDWYVFYFLNREHKH